VVSHNAQQPQQKERSFNNTVTPPDGTVKTQQIQQIEVYESENQSLGQQAMQAINGQGHFDGPEGTPNINVAIKTLYHAAGQAAEQIEKAKSVNSEVQSQQLRMEQDQNQSKSDMQSLKGMLMDVQSQLSDSETKIRDLKLSVQQEHEREM